MQLGCPKCSSTFSSTNLLKLHYKKFHKVEGGLQPPKKIFAGSRQNVSSAKSISLASAMTCSFCDKVVTKDEYLAHFKVSISY